MQSVRHVGGAEHIEVLRNPYSVFDGVDGSVIALGQLVRG